MPFVGEIVFNKVSKLVTASAALVGACLAVPIAAADEWKGLNWNEATDAQFRLYSRALGYDSEKLVELMKSTVWGESHRRGYKNVYKVQQPDDTKLLCISIGERASQYTIFVVDAAADSAWTSNFCRH